MLLKNKKWRGREIIEPNNSLSYPLVWTPEPFLADIGKDGIVEHQTPEVPNTVVLLATEISKVQFDRHASYLAGKEYHSAVWQTLKYTSSADPIHLLAEENSNEIYCVSTPMNTMVVFGKLLKRCKVYAACMKSFKAFCREYA